MQCFYGSWNQKGPNSLSGRVFAQIFGTALYPGVFWLGCLNSAFPTFSGNCKFLWGACHTGECHTGTDLARRLVYTLEGNLDQATPSLLVEGLLPSAWSNGQESAGHFTTLGCLPRNSRAYPQAPSQALLHHL